MWDGEEEETMSETGCQRFFVMRQGASASNLAGVVQGVMDVPLALLGKEQAAEAG
jgi:broad specificity phosphatase PhoE